MTTPVHVTVKWLGNMAQYRTQKTTGEFARKDISLRVPNDGRKYVRIRHFYEIFGKPNPVPYAVPEIVNKDWGLITKHNGAEYDYVPLENRWQWFLWNFWDWASDYRLPLGKIEYFYQKPGNDRIFAHATPGSLTWVYVNLIEAHRAWTESASPEGGFRDVVTGRNIQNTKPYAFLMRPTAGHLARVKRQNGSRWVLEALDLLQPCPDMKYLIANPHLYFWATQANQEQLEDGRYICSRFPQIKEAFEVHNLPVAGTPVPFMSLGGEIEIARSACEEIQAGAEWSPYVP